MLDFGLVKVLDEAETQITADGTTTGTPSYMAPEIALGNPRVDGRTDIYSLGCVAYWLLTGSLVFEENGATATILAHVQKIPVPPSERSELDVPASLDRAIMMCLAKDPAQCPADVEALERILEDSVETVPWGREDAHNWWHTNIPQEVVPEVSESQLVP